MEDGVGRGQHFLVLEDGEDSTAGHLQYTYLVESSAETIAKRSQQLVTLTKKKQRDIPP